MNYRSMLNAHAFNSLCTSARIPDFRLGIGEAERLSSVPVLLFTDVCAPAQKIRCENPTKESIEKNRIIGSGKAITYDDFETDDFFEALHVKGDY